MDNPFRRGHTQDGSFLPSDYVRGKRDQRTNVLGLTLFAVVMLGICGAFVVTNRQWKSVRAEQARIGKLYAEEQIKIEQLKSLEAQREQLMERAEVTTALVERTPRSVLLGELTMRLPDTAALTEVELTSKRVRAVAANPTKNTQVRSLKGRSAKGDAKDAKPRIEPPRFTQSLVIEGVADDNAAIADYLSSLQACDLFSSVELEFIRQTRVNKIELRRFQIRASIRSDADVTQLASVEATSLLAPPARPPVAGEAPLTEAERAAGALAEDEGKAEDGAFATVQPDGEN